MKTNILIIAFAWFASIAGAQAQSNTSKATIKVYGNCVMCKERIEGALDREGIKQASWDTETKMLDIVYNSKKISEKEIHEIISSVGHDTEKVKAKDTVYADLPFCCLYRDHEMPAKGKH